MDQKTTWTTKEELLIILVGVATLTFLTTWCFFGYFFYHNKNIFNRSNSNRDSLRPTILGQFAPPFRSISAQLRDIAIPMTTIHTGSTSPTSSLKTPNLTNTPLNSPIHTYYSQKREEIGLPTLNIHPLSRQNSSNIETPSLISLPPPMKTIINTNSSIV